MGEMDRSAKTPSQLPGDLDCFHRHFREVDWNDDVSNFQRFHAHNMKSLQLAGSAFLAKDRAFFGAAFSRDAVSARSRRQNIWHQMLLPTRLPEETRARNSVGD
jgi:hypothetical protein